MNADLRNLMEEAALRLLAEDVLEILATKPTGREAVSVLLNEVRGTFCRSTGRYRWRGIGTLSHFEALLERAGFSVIHDYNERNQPVTVVCLETEAEREWRRARDRAVFDAGMMAYCDAVEIEGKSPQVGRKRQHEAEVRARRAWRGRAA